MTLHIVLAILAAVCGVAAIFESDARWAGLGVVVLAVALVF